MTEGEVIAWAERLGVSIPPMGALGLTGAAADGRASGGRPRLSAGR